MTPTLRFVSVALVAGLALGLGAAKDAEAQQAQPRRFRHEIHQNLPCTGCHASGGQHGVPRGWTPASCAACHHDPARNMACEACHPRETYTAPRLVVQTLQLSVWDQSRTRELGFDHGLHVRLDCRRCHQGEGLLTPRVCADCHQSHHRPEVECAQCHRAPDPGVHGLEAHRSCAGSGCHSDAATRRPMLSRPSCLICHETKRDHKPGRSCITCHIIPRPPASQRLLPAAGRDPTPNP